VPCATYRCPLVDNPYKAAPARAFWKKAVSSELNPADLISRTHLIRRGDKVASAGSCFASNIVPFIERAGFEYIRVDNVGHAFGRLAEDNFGYSRFSAKYGNIYTARQAAQLLKRALGEFRPVDDRWIVGDDLVLDPFRPGLKYPAASQGEFDVLTTQHLRSVLEVFRQADVFIFTLGLTEAWVSRIDGAVYPACPGTIAGTFDPERHGFHNFSVREVSDDLDELIRLTRRLNPRLRFVLTVSPVPLVATATDDHVLLATIYSKSVLRVAAGEAAHRHDEVVYFPAYEIVTGPQAPEDFFEADRREPSARAIRHVMRAFLANCDTSYQVADDDVSSSRTKQLSEGALASPAEGSGISTQPAQDDVMRLSRMIADLECEEAAAGL
jgi:hypothetical protein